MRLFKHQEQILKMGKTRNSLGLWWEMGTGKTLATIELAVGYKGNCCVVCPKIVIDTWAKEIQERNMRGYFKNGKSIDPIWYVADTSQKKRMEFFKHTKLSPHLSWDTHAFLIINYEALRNKELFDALFKAFKIGQLTTLVADESHRIKNIKSKQSKAMIELSSLAKHKLALTGTPLTNSATDIFAQAKFLDGGKTFGESEYAFKQKYCIPTYYIKNRPVAWSTNPKRLGELNKKFNSLGLRVKKEDVLDLPNRTVKDIYVDLSLEQKKAYMELKNSAMTVFSENEFCACPNVLTELIRLQQCVSGHLPRQTFMQGQTVNTFVFEKTPRMTALIELLNDLQGHKTIVWTSFKEDIKQIGNALLVADISFTSADGSLSQAERGNNIDKFKQDKEVAVLIANRQACSEGINLAEASYSITYSRGFSFSQEKQAEARNYRSGSEQHKKITHFNLIAKGTIDEKIIKALKNKQNIAQAVVEDFKL